MRKSQFTFRSDHHNVHTEKINKITLSSNDDKRIQTNNKITTYPYGYFDNNEIVDNKENNTKSVQDILREEAKTLRNNSKILKEEVKNIIKENNTKSEVDIVREESKALTNNSIILREETNTIRNNSKGLREEINYILKEFHAIKEDNTKGELDILREEVNALRNNSIILREEGNTI